MIQKEGPGLPVEEKLGYDIVLYIWTNPHECFNKSDMKTLKKDILEAFGLEIKYNSGMLYVVCSKDNYHGEEWHHEKQNQLFYYIKGWMTGSFPN